MQVSDTGNSIRKGSVLGGILSHSRSYRKVMKAAGQATRGRLMRGEADEASRSPERRPFLGP